MKQILDMLVLGSGPAGLTAGIYARRAGLDVLVAEREYMGTGQIAESSRVDNYPGLPGISGYDLGEKLRAHAEQMGVPFLEGEAVRLTKKEDVFRVDFADGEYRQTRTVIYALGTEHRRLGCPGEEELLGRGISFCAACDGAFYQDKTVAVIGGGDTAADDAVYLSGICKKVWLIHRRDRLRACDAARRTLQEKANVELVLNNTPVRFSAANGGVQISLKSGEKMQADGVFLAVGMKPRTGLLQGIMPLDEGGFIPADENGITTLPGFFAAGDVRTKALRQVITAAADGANAATSAQNYLANKRI